MTFSQKDDYNKLHVQIQMQETHKTFLDMYLSVRIQRTSEGPSVIPAD